LTLAISSSVIWTEWLSLETKPNWKYPTAPARHWRWMVPHDPPALIDLFGGDEAFVDELEEFMVKGVPWFEHAAIAAGGTLEFEMTADPTLGRWNFGD